MTTKIEVYNKGGSNGAVHIRGVSTWETGAPTIQPGERTEIGLTDSSIVTVFETMPAAPDDATRIAIHNGDTADDLIRTEVAKQDRMWGVSNERADSAGGELLQAALAQAAAVDGARATGDTWRNRKLYPPGWNREAAFKDASETYYPSNWSGFRDYGSDVANLVVAAAFLRQDIKRLIASGADTTRRSRDLATEPYTADQPASE